MNLAILDDILYGNGAVSNLHLILLNYELQPSWVLKAFVRVAKSVTCADGGFHRLLQRLSVEELRGLPDMSKLVIGDGDSLFPNSSSTLRLLEECGFRFIQVENEDTTDFTKSWDYLIKNKIIESPKELVIVDGAFGGRFDQTTNCIKTLYDKRGMNAIFVGPQTVVTIIPPGDNEIKLPTKFCKNVCGLLPFVPVRRVNTEGLRWNIVESRMSIDSLCSTSNQALSSRIRIETSDPILWYSESLDFSRLDQENHAFKA